MQNFKEHTQRVNQKSRPSHRGRVVDLRTFRRKKRLRSLCGPLTWRRYFLSGLVKVLLAAAVALAMASCLPWAQRPQMIACTWLLAIVGAGCGLALHVLRDRQAQRLLLGFVVCMAVSLASAVFLVRS
ncbi:hypothetical protein [Alicyclobacillus shizuokensis]|uniref:hypothetical protein n=1 Tax=Alicyclobacillus shizuokensis TaxID=392014 RepID=UPI000835483B|nr:hypothetical protein [Alicyclobacillus shizuokensis]MCL6626683.1 hypothetical protein [Alicyclobacillus shizuokensis]